MRIEEFERRLNWLLDQRRGWDGDPEIVRSIRDSAEHRELAQVYREAIDPKTLQQVDPLPRCLPPADLASRVLMALATPSPAAARTAGPTTGEARFDGSLPMSYVGWLAKAGRFNVTVLGVAALGAVSRYG